jgi:hypothetical protein
MSITALAAALVAASLGIESANQAAPAAITQKVTQQMNPYIGMWVTGDGRIRQELLANGRYDEARGERKSAYQGRYEIRGDRIDYWDDTGFTADGVFVDDDTLHHGGMIFYREKRG